MSHQSALPRIEVQATMHQRVTKTNTTSGFRACLVYMRCISFGYITFNYCYFALYYYYYYIAFCCIYYYYFNNCNRYYYILLLPHTWWRLHLSLLIVYRYLHVINCSCLWLVAWTCVLSPILFSIYSNEMSRNGQWPLWVVSNKSSLFLSIPCRLMS